MKEPGRILLSRMKFIGDVVLTTPLIRTLREVFPRAYLAYLGDSQAVSLLEWNPFLDEIIPFDFSRNVLVEQPRVMWLLRRRHFDVTIDLFSNPRSALLMAASGARVRIGKDSQGRGMFYTHRIRDDGLQKTAVEFHYQYLRPLGVTARSFRTEVFLTDTERVHAERHLVDLGVDRSLPIVGLHPGATWPAKMWPAERFGDLARILTEERGVQVVVTQGPGDSDIVQRVAAAAAGKVYLPGPLPLRRLAALLAALNVYVANDAGPMHIAVALGTTTVGIFGPGEDAIWFPYAQPWFPPDARHLALRKHVPCHPCHLDFCPLGGEMYLKCMKLLTAREVFDRVVERLPA